MQWAQWMQRSGYNGDNEYNGHNGRMSKVDLKWEKEALKGNPPRTAYRLKGAVPRPGGVPPRWRPSPTQARPDPPDRSGAKGGGQIHRRPMDNGYNGCNGDNGYIGHNGYEFSLVSATAVGPKP